jgi:hypothetical protein
MTTTDARRIRLASDGVVASYLHEISTVGSRRGQASGRDRAVRRDAARGLRARRAPIALEAAAKEAGWKIERAGSLIAVRDVWTENEDHAAWLVATKVGLPLERVTVWAGRDGG